MIKGSKHTQETKLKIASFAKTRIGVKSARGGKKNTPEHNEKIRLANIGKKHSTDTKKKISISSSLRQGGKNTFVGTTQYHSTHQWVYKKLGSPKICTHCKRTDAKKYEWANISQLYLLDTDDWVRLCTSCHRKMDIHIKCDQKF